MFSIGNKVVIIAEAGVNHNGDLELAKELIKVAAEAGADFVKFQTFKASKLASSEATKAEYQKINTKDGENSQFRMLERLEVPGHWYPILIKHCQEFNIQFLSTGFDESSIDFIQTLNPPFYKIPSGEITNKPYLQHVSRKGKPILLSTGMAYLDEIRDAIQIFLHEGMDKKNLTVLHCNTEYPTPMEDVNLLAMLHIQRELGVKVGYSDHTIGIEVPIAAVALGAMVIEKHFTLDRNLPGPDHAASIEPSELKQMVSCVRNIELALSGDGQKAPSRSELKNISIARKSLHYKRDLPKGNIIENEDIIALRPGDGISPMNINDILGKKLLLGIKGGQQISYSDFE